MIDLRSDERGVVVPVSAKAGGGKTGVLGARAGRLRLGVSAPAERGKANEALAKLLAETIGCPVSRVKLISGATRREKRFLIEDDSVERVQERLNAVIGG